jgi:hypothetical protein
MTDRRMRQLGFLGLAIAILAAPGCIRRTLTINTTPQGARILLNDQEVGTSPVSVDFTWYGDYRVMVQKEGYKTLQTHKTLATPTYELPGVDFFTEILWPFTVEDRRELNLELELAGEPIAREKLLDQAKQFRERALFGED